MAQHPLTPAPPNGPPDSAIQALQQRLAELERQLDQALEREYCYQALISSSSEGIWRFDLRQPVSTGAPPAEQLAQFYAHGYLAECNQAMARMYGFEETADILDQPLNAFLVESDPANSAYLECFIASGYRLVDALSHETDRHGADRYFLNGLVGVVKHGMLLGAWGYQRDVTDLHAAQQEQQRLVAEARQALDARDEFLSIAAHELKTPLTSLAGYSQLLQRRLSRAGALAAGDQRALGIIIAQSNRLQRMLGAMLDLSRLQTGQLTIALARLNLVELVAAVVDELLPLHPDHQLNFLPPDEVFFVQGDDMRLEQVVYNLLSNAVKYSPGGGPVEIQLRRAGAEVALSIRDHGLGIDAAALGTIFELFARAPTTGQAISGMGVGLYVVREIVSLHGGRVAVESEPGAGSCFRVSLPLRD